MASPFKRTNQGVGRWTGALYRNHHPPTAKSKKLMVPKEGLPTVLRWNLQVFVVKPDLHNGLGLAQRKPYRLPSTL